jgi:hypothetical protein
MPYRTFIDTAGIEWQVWDVVPRLSERRSGETTDRRVDIVPISFADRRAQHRRVTQSRKAFLRGTYAQGWLCFDSNREKRRLTPIPTDWTTCSEELLDVYARHAQSVPAPYRSFGFTDDEPMAEAG